MVVALLFTLAASASGQHMVTGGVVLTGAPDSCGAVSPTVGWGMDFTDEGAVAGFAGPEAELRGLPCQGVGLLAGGRGGVQLGFVRLGAALTAGPTWSFEYDESGLMVQPAVFLGARVGKVEWTVVRAGLSSGYLGQGWIDLRSVVSVQF